MNYSQNINMQPFIKQHDNVTHDYAIRQHFERYIYAIPSPQPKRIRAARCRNLDEVGTEMVEEQGRPR